uniref:restriction endonuclease subunit S n=2 Tax=Acinetobacter TaxID=469 RepID=UPI0022B3C2C6
MAKYQKYAEYKYSGIDWLGEIPNHWNVGNLKFSFVGIKNGATETQIEESNNTVPISRIESISTGEINYEKVGFVNKYSIAESYKINEGDILLSHINSLSMVGNIALKRDTSILYHGMNLLRLMPNKDKFDPKYLFWILKSKYFRNSVESIAKPAINQASVSIDSLKNISLLIPTKIEQQDIANFLDHETSKIDHLIEKQQQLIELLKEKRQAVISHAVTKGLNPNVPMKDSG